jgi:hypothetical protein
MSSHEPASPERTRPAALGWTATSAPLGSGRQGGVDADLTSWSPDSSAPLTEATHSSTARIPRLSSRRSRRAIVAALMCAAIGLCAACGASTSTPAATGPHGPGASASKARSGPASGGSSGKVDSVSTSGFTLSTSTGQKVTVDEASSTTYQRGTSQALSTSVTNGESALVLGTTSGTTISARQVIVEPTRIGGSPLYSPSAVAPFQQGSPSAAEQDGQVPANYTEGTGTIVGGTAANKATEAALSAYPGGVVDRVVQVQVGDYEVHYIGVNWPHHIFVNRYFTVVGAD